jgi:hypothetical protein
MANDKLDSEITKINYVFGQLENEFKQLSNANAFKQTIDQITTDINSPLQLGIAELQAYHLKKMNFHQDQILTLIQDIGIRKGGN